MLADIHHRKILVIDDEEYLVKLLKSRLLINRFDVVTAANGKEGLEAVVREKPDLIILDVLMPEMNGAEFLRELKSNPELARTPVIVISAQPETQKLFNPSDIQAFVQKPFDPEDFISRVKRSLQSPKKD